MRHLGNRQTRKVTLGRLEDNDKVQVAAKSKDEPTEKPVTQKALGLDLATLSKDLRTKYKIKDSVKGVIVTSVDSASDAAEKRLSAGDVIVEVSQTAVETPDDVAKRIEALKKWPSPARSTSDALNRAGGSGRIASAGARRIALRTAPHTPTTAARALAMTATSSTPVAR